MIVANIYMLATFVIGLREGLEAALIVGIIAAFLRKNGKSLVAMWVGVWLAVALSIAVGVGLDLVEQALPQARQEGMESIIGAIAIFFVTGMIVWMNTHARDMKQQLEAEAAQALSQASAYALASMAFLAVLKEGFETSVFLLATFSAAQSAILAATGAVIGLLIAVGIGWGIFVGGARINLSKFFRITGAFLILVAAGLVITSLRTAHEAGWLNAGQQNVVNLSWLVAPGTIQSALITGLLGIPANPRLIEVIGWFAYLIPVALFIYWPQDRRPGPRSATRLKLSLAAVLAVIALGLIIFYPRPRVRAPAEASIVNTTGVIGTARLDGNSNSTLALHVSFKGSGESTLSLPENKRQIDRHDGIDASFWNLTRTSATDGAPSMLTFDQIVAMNGGRIPVGLNLRQHPGPFTANWLTHRSTRIWTAEGILLDAAERSATIVTLSGSGLQTPRTLTLVRPEGADLTSNWHISHSYLDQAVAALNLAAAARTERLLWAVQLPIMLAFIALFLAVAACRSLDARARRSAATIANSTSPINFRADDSTEGLTHAKS